MNLFLEDNSMNTKIIALRGTIFTQRIQLDNNALTKLLPLFEGFSVEMVPVGNDVPFPVPVSFNWSLVTPTKDCRITFGNSTIDIVKTQNVEFSKAVISDFTQFCKSSYLSILSQFGNIVSRMAIAPTLKVELANNDEFIALTEKIASVQKFKNTPIGSMAFSDVYRVKEEICGSQILINYLSNFNASENYEGGEGMVIKEVVFSSDINTFQLSHNEFHSEHIQDFFTKVDSWFFEFYRFYFA